VKQIKYLILLAFLAGTVGCQKNGKRCDELIGVINQGVEIKNKYEKQGPVKDPKQYLAMAQDWEKLKEKIGAVSLRDDELKGLSGEYQELLGDYVRILREAARAVESKDEAAAQKVRAEIKAVTEDRQALLTNKINAYCSSK